MNIMTLPENTTVEACVYDSFESLEPTQNQWDAFVESVGCDVFMTYDWQRIWWKYYGADRLLKIFIFRHNSQLVGIIPLFFEKIRLGFVSMICGKIVDSDFSIYAVTLPVCREFLSAVMENFFTNIRTCDWDALHIGPLAGLYDNFGHILGLCGRCQQNGFRIKTTVTNIQTFFLLAASDGQPIEMMSRKQEKQIRQKYRILYEALGGQGKAITSCFSTEAEFEKSFANFVDMHQRHWQKQNQAGHFGDWPASLEFHHEVALSQLKRGRLRLMEVKTDGQPLGYKYSYKFGDTFVEFLDARADGDHFSRAGLGNIVFYEQLKKAQQEQVRYINSGRGKYEHKLRMGGKFFDMNNIYIFRNSSVAAARVNIFRVCARLLDICYYKIWFSRLAPKLALWRRPLWKLWIRSVAFAT